MVIQREQYVAELLRKRSHPQGLQCRCGYRHQEWTKKNPKNIWLYHEDYVTLHRRNGPTND